MFVDNSGRRSKLLRRIGLLAGVLCLGYAGVLGLAFMGIGTGTPSSLLPFAGGGPGGAAPQGGAGTPRARPGGTPPAGTAHGRRPSSAPSASASAAASATTAG
ncbi:hypothetical protein ACIBL8_40720 [Streptomyces sp. NPDC050523]|uniref:hypothetical protein n=1 Tax=Streptomyces sp. NPDC050523 TaxID=3365622 RepID=UPI0037A1F648